MSEIQGPPPEEPQLVEPQQVEAKEIKPKSETWVKVLLGVIGSVVGATAIVLVVAAVGILAVIGLVLFTCSSH